MIYNQGKTGYCVGYAIANAIEQTTGKVLRKEDVENFYAKHDKDGREGMTVKEALKIMKEFDMGGFSVDWFEEIYHVYKGNTHKFMDARIRQSLLKPHKAVIAVLRVRGKLKLNDKNILLKKTGKFTGFHAVLLNGLWLNDKRKSFGYKLENSWGSDWGDNGYFYVPYKLFRTEVHSLYSVTFTK